MNYKQMIIFPLILIIISISYLSWKFPTTGLNLDIDLKGGTQIVAESQASISENTLESVLKDYSANVRIAKGIAGYSIYIEFESETEPKDIISTLAKNGYVFDSYSVQSVGPALGASFLQQAIFVLMFSFIFMAITVFIIFRTPLPSFYVVLTAFVDILETLSISQIFGVKLSLATFAALLLLIGYSVDDNILMTTRVLKTAGGEVKEKIKSSFKTGMTMVGTTSVALSALFIISESIVIDQIASVLVIGLLVDLLNSWVLNSGLLRWYMERRNK
jgi:preprotein translocase subunit SecF